MTFKEQMISDATTVFLNTSDHAESITHFPSGTAAVTGISAIVEREISFDPSDSEQGRRRIKHATIFAAITVIDPSKDQFDIDGDGRKWGIEGGHVKDVGGVSEIKLVLVEPIERSAEKMRLPL